MTLRGTCTCGRLLWFDTIDVVIKNAEKNKMRNSRIREHTDILERYVKNLKESRPNGELVCVDCGKHYTEEEFRKLKDCKCYGEDAPEESYQQAIAEAYKEISQNHK
jgi:hypothetical protein